MIIYLFLIMQMVLSSHLRFHRQMELLVRLVHKELLGLLVLQVRKEQLAQAYPQQVQLGKY